MKKNGSLLVEILIAMFIIVFCFLFILGIFPVSYRSVKQSKDILFATELAKMQIERITCRKFIYGNKSIFGGKYGYNVLIDNTESNMDFIYDVIVNPDDASTLALETTRIKNILVTVNNARTNLQIVKLETDMPKEKNDI